MCQGVKGWPSCWHLASATVEHSTFDGPEPGGGSTLESLRTNQQANPETNMYDL